MACSRWSRIFVKNFAIFEVSGSGRQAASARPKLSKFSPRGFAQIVSTIPTAKSEIAV
jgi:hypothetical protein